MKWSQEAEQAVAKVPFFVRRRVRKRVEEEASGQGARVVELAHVTACRNRFLANMEDEVKGYQLETCFASSGCPNRAVVSDDLVRDLEKLLAAAGFREFLKERVNGPLKMHHEFRVTLAECPNACSRPQIVDIGIIGAAFPAASEEPCNRCGACVEICREGAISLLPEDLDRPAICGEKCVACGQCVTACPSGTLVESKSGYRMLLGGKLGRHPQLATELPGIHSASEILKLTDRCIAHYKRHNRAGERFGEILIRTGYDFLDGDGRK
ncbi:MAG: 4Fe-4S binding protein [Desulfomonile tiedjei]|nr:4Fe-4S binding protein [Desulfomonile tiedjei]